MQVLAFPGDGADNGRGSPAEFEQVADGLTLVCAKIVRRRGPQLARKTQPGNLPPSRSSVVRCCAATDRAAYQIFLVHCYLERCHTKSIATATAPCKATFGAHIIRRRSPASNACPPGAYSLRGKIRGRVSCSPGALAQASCKAAVAAVGFGYGNLSYRMYCLQPLPPQPHRETVEGAC